MYPWTEVYREGDPDTTFAYWLLVEKKNRKPEKYDLDDMGSWFSLHYEAEEQAYGKSDIRNTGKYMKDLQPVSPISLAYKWTPYELATEILGEPDYHKREESDFHPFTLARYNAKHLGELFPDKNRHNDHEKHFIYLLRLACAYAEIYTGRVYLLGSVGWSYEDEVKNGIFNNPQVSLVMHQAGYLYSERIGINVG